jgi:hypothetical protein
MTVVAGEIGVYADYSYKSSLRSKLDMQGFSPNKLN